MGPDARTQLEQARAFEFWDDHPVLRCGPRAQYPPTERLLRLLSFMEHHIHSVAYSPWVYVVLSLLLLPFTLYRYLRGAAALPLLFVLSGSAYMLSYLVGASSITRYCVWTISCTVLALFALAGELLRHRLESLRSQVASDLQ